MKSVYSHLELAWIVGTKFIACSLLETYKYKQTVEYPFFPQGSSNAARSNEMKKLSYRASNSKFQSTRNTKWIRTFPYKKGSDNS